MVLCYTRLVSYTLTFLLLFVPHHIPPLLNILARISTLRIAGRDSNVLLTDGSRWPMIHTFHFCVMMITRDNGFGRLYVTATLLCDVCVRVSPADV